MSEGAPPLGHLLVEADAPLRCRVHPCAGSETPPLEEGQVLVHVAKLAVTANTLTYAVAGKDPNLRYFQHFPVPVGAPAQLAMSPCWGTGVVTASRCPNVPAGVRIHGLFPFSPTVVLMPAKVTAVSFRDGSSHRAGLIAAYSTYTFHESPQFRGLSYDDEDFEMAAGALFTTGWAMAHSAAVHEAKPSALVLTSASSRTSQAAAFAAQFQRLPLRVVGLTAAANADFVRSLGTYDVVCAYEDVAELPRQRVAIQDVAGNPEVREALYRHFGDDVVLCGTVGLSHLGSAASRPARLKGLGGSRPQPFLVFTAMEAIGKVYGRRETATMAAEASRAFAAKMRPSCKAVRRYGAEETRAVFEEIASGRVNSQVTYVCSLWPKELHDPMSGGRSRL